MAGERSRVSGSGRQETSLLRQAKFLPGTATGNRWTHRFPSREIVLRDCHVALLLAMTWIFATKLGCKKNLHPIEWRFVFALPIFPGSRPPSIVGVHELNFCVRDGNRWTLMTINTNYICQSFIALTTYLTQLKMVTRTGFEPMLTA